ncbi:MAG: type III restriction-modification system endonuclease, partial [Campylobacterales bacterium]|nr:type III restriction-modification system endonuclease [Campylobacterales bacterium]
NLFDTYNNPFEALASLQPIVILDEPHKFKVDNKTWKNIEKFKAQWIFRYGATFDNKEENLLYRLSAVDAFNDNLVKGVVTYIEEFSDGQNAIVRLKSADSKEAVFELNENGKKSEVRMGKNEVMTKVHPEMNDVTVENLKRNCVVLSNGLEVTTKMDINPYSYSQSIQDKMIQKAIIKHFEIEKEMLTREVKIKPLTLFFIDDIEGYRDAHQIAGSLKSKFEKFVNAHIKKLLVDEEHPFYREYLKKSLVDVSLTHGGYFSKDNSGKDEAIEKEINEILHDKEELLSLENPRRFIFSKWTLREGWDNPNVFQICKLRSSGSVTSKLQEVGRGLRLPVNEFMSRVKGEKFELNYYVDFSEKDFAQSLVDEINSKSGVVFVPNPKKLTDEMISKILTHYAIDEEELLESLDEVGAIKRNNDFKEGGYEKLKEKYPLVLIAEDGLKANKVRNGNEPVKKATIRAGKYQELKSLWESINQKVILEYKIENEDRFYDLLKGYLQESIEKFKPQGVETHQRTIEFKGSVAYYKEIESLNDEILPISYMRYSEFLIELATTLKININTLHRVFYDLRTQVDINLYLNMQTIRTLRGGFNKYLLDNAMSKFFIGYNTISNGTHIHRTAFTNEKGEVDTSKLNTSDLGVFESNEQTADNYLFEELFFDSELERDNILNQIEEVTVFTKIPKNSIKIPVAGGGTYSPDFAYVIKDSRGKQSLNLIVETKNKDERDLYTDEKEKIAHAQELFSTLNSDIEVKFETQFKSQQMSDILRGYITQLG